MVQLPFKSVFILLLINLLTASCGKDLIITPENGYEWPGSDRDYWPTEEWRISQPISKGIDPQKLEKADQFAANDRYSKALLIVKDGYIVFEKYYHGADKDHSSNLWSVTKSFTSALVGLLYDQNYFSSTDQLMRNLMPEYPEFNEISLHHALTMTTGLSWVEEGPAWVNWILSDDWVASALARGQIREPGEEFFYSSANSHFLTAMIKNLTGRAPGDLAKENIFNPLGISFEVMPDSIQYTTWDQYTLPLSQTWRKDPQGIECASFALYLTARDMAKFGFLYLNKGKWDNQTILSEEWIENSTKDHEIDIYGRYSYGYQWYLTFIDQEPAFLASGFGGQIIGIVPSLDLVVVLKYEAENPIHPETGTKHDDMHLFELVVNSVN
jgi:CubicO group peptidase (beta-lactamase class C family)